MENKQAIVLVVDDEPLNLELITEYLTDINIDTLCVDNGEEALSVLQESPHRFSAVLLDRVMPGIDGIEVLSKIRENNDLKALPVIMQTAKTGSQSMLEGLNAGAHYYLAKPYDRKMLMAVTSTAVRSYNRYATLKNSLNQSTQTFKMMDRGFFSFKSLDEGRKLAMSLANACPDSERVVLGLTELIINAIEHGNLGITYREKSTLNADGKWESEISRRLSLAMYKDKYATIEFARNLNNITFIITDQGEGFDWRQYMKISPDRAFDSHGRGIALAKSISFDEIEYRENGKKVCATVLL